MAALLVPMLAAVGVDDLRFVYAAYLIVVGGLVAFAVLTMRRGRRLARQLPPEDRRWM